ncbi:hypothetical protein V6N13_148221 [Hibiscus sabdariffa]
MLSLATHLSRPEPPLHARCGLPHIQHAENTCKLVKDNQRVIVFDRYRTVDREHAWVEASDGYDTCTCIASNVGVFP